MKNLGFLVTCPSKMANKGQNLDSKQVLSDHKVLFMMTKIFIPVMAVTHEAY